MIKRREKKQDVMQQDEMQPDYMNDQLMMALSSYTSSDHLAAYADVCSNNDYVATSQAGYHDKAELMIALTHC